MKFLLIFLFILILRSLINAVRYLQTKDYLDQYFEWLRDKTWNYIEKRAKAISLLHNANIKDLRVENVELAGYGLVSTSTISVFDNFPHDRKDIASAMIKKFHEAMGVYKQRIWESFSPLFWIQWLIYLPRNIFRYLDLNPERIIIKIVQIVYWILGLLISLIWILYHEEITTKAKQIIETFEYLI